MKNIEKVVIPMIVIMMITMLGIYFISKEYEKQRAQKRAEQIKETVEENPAADEELEYESLAVLVGKDEENGKLKFISVDSESVYELEYTSKTKMLAKHGNYVTLDEIPLGEILDVTYSIHNRDLLKMQISSEAWTFTDVTKFEIDENEGRMEVAGSTYRLPKTAIVSYKDELASFMDVTNVDTLIVKGVGRKVCSVIVDRGHGYVRLLNDTYFEGGWIEIGQEIIKPVTEGMLIPTPEGSYHVRLTNRGYAAEEDIVVERDKESEIDLSKADIMEVAIGHVEFAIVPDYAQLYIDGEMTDFEERVPLEFGIHKILVQLAGYKSVSTNIRVNDEYANVDIVLEKDDGGSSSSSSLLKTTSVVRTSSSGTTGTAPAGTTGSTIPYLRTSSSAQTTSTSSKTTSSSSSSSTDQTTSSSSTEEVISDTRKMYVESPEGVEVYVDGMYMGITPISFIKPERGSHVITLSKHGYVTKSYTIAVSNDGRDVTLSFSELIEEQDSQE